MPQGNAGKKKLRGRKAYKKPSGDWFCHQNLPPIYSTDNLYESLTVIGGFGTRFWCLCFRGKLIIYSPPHHHTFPVSPSNSPRGSICVFDTPFNQLGGIVSLLNDLLKSRPKQDIYKHRHSLIPFLKFSNNALY